MKINPMQLVILALAVWRVASLFANESGPRDFFGRLRARIGVKIDANGKYANNVFAKGLICVWCSSVWFGAVALALFTLAPDQTVFVAAAFAVSTIAVLLEEILNALME